MKIKLLSGLFCLTLLYAQDQQIPVSQQNNTQNSSSQIIQCNIIFEQRKNEILDKIKDLEDKTQSLKILQKASEDIFTQRQNQIKTQEQALKEKEKEILEKEKALNQANQDSQDKIKKLIAKNEEILRQIQDESTNKLAQTYSKMKDSKAADILSDLPENQAAGILFLLKAQDIGKILAKMDPRKAASLTERLRKGAPFEDETPNKKVPQVQNQKEDTPEGLPEESEDTKQKRPMI